MILPRLTAWIEQPNHLSGLRVKSGDAVTLVLITEWAGDPDVLLLRQTAERLGG